MVISEWVSERLDWKAKVVCEKCNNTWMSDIENNHAKPAVTDLIVGKVDVPIPRSRARSRVTSSHDLTDLQDLSDLNAQLKAVSDCTEPYPKDTGRCTITF